MAEQDNQDFHDDDPAPTGSRGTRRGPMSPPRTQRGRGTRARRRPSQTEILAGNVRDLTELVRALVDTRRDANIVQFPEEPPEVAESTPSRPPRSGSRPRNPSPTGGRGSDRMRRESPRRQQQERADPSRVRSRNRHSQATRSAAVEPPAATGGMPGDRVRETVNVRGSTTSVFDLLGRPGVHCRIGRERSVDKPVKDEDYNQNRLDQLQRQLDQLVGQQYGMDQLGAVAPPLLRSSWRLRTRPERQRGSPMQIILLNLNWSSSPVVPEASPRVDRLLQAAGRYLRSCVPKLEDQEAESVPPVRHQTRRNRGAKKTLAYDRPPTFAQLRGIAWRHAEADEYVRGRGLASRKEPEDASGEVPAVHPAGDNHLACPQPGDWTGTAPRPSTAQDRPCTEESKQVLQLPQGRGPRHKGLHTAPRPDRAADPRWPLAGDRGENNYPSRAEQTRPGRQTEPEAERSG
ncbi:hypothetical protein TIFTF001_042983 [Ficus carica]|uniref:Uncharacterized protein n=1 Tax=Ficus carica TaxID=3494 RepID=A0AA87YVP7_FICCA|nr:hypothetical protein TIFTF001_042974 [Ficus carica]GMN20059.1 hypothetical protein TIFTF001_042983 [Ficus carica]